MTFTEVYASRELLMGSWGNPLKVKHWGLGLILLYGLLRSSWWALEDIPLGLRPVLEEISYRFNQF